MAPRRSARLAAIAAKSVPHQDSKSCEETKNIRVICNHDGSRKVVLIDPRIIEYPQPPTNELSVCDVTLYIVTWVLLICTIFPFVQCSGK